MLDCEGDEGRRRAVYDEWVGNRFKGTAWEWEGRKRVIGKVSAKL
jgi:dual specificity phosphatase 12